MWLHVGHMELSAASFCSVLFMKALCWYMAGQVADVVPEKH